ncbi:MAG: hypothetical protein JWL90_1192 [Chthoniobacteraceae bacterium]|nr:hypothetical protein [Chthoniobacteraceae bacterium]
MKNEEHDDLWQLLAKAKEPAVSPFFARNVLRAIRKQEKPAGLFDWLPRLRALTAALGLLAITVAGISTLTRPNRNDQIAALAQEVSDSPDYTVISHLDELLAYEENSAWLDKPVY